MFQQQTLEQKISAWETQRELKNLMGKYALTMLLEQRDEAYDRFWSTCEDVCLGVNEGWYAGKEAIRGYYAAQARRTAAESELLAGLFPEKFAGMSGDQRYGVGHLDNRPVSTPVIVVAGDGKTAKGMWTSMGCYTCFDPEFGPQSHWNWSVYAVDFCKEEDGWKIWHMRCLTELDALCGRDWTKPPLERELKPRPEFRTLKQAQVPGPNRPERLHTPWSAKRLRADLPHLPQPYGSFAETFSYGM